MYEGAVCIDEDSFETLGGKIKAEEEWIVEVGRHVFRD